MPENEAEWQELSDFLAREVMGYHEETSYELLVWAGTSDDGKKHWIAQYAWRPDKNIDQAMLVLKTLLAKIGRYAEAELHIRIRPSRCRVTIQNWVASDGVPAGYMRSQYVDNEMQAICLAAKAWCKAQKEREGS